MVNLEKIKNEGINQSVLKTVSFLPSKIDEDTSLFYEEKECLILGNLIDCMLLTPELFADKFYVDTLNIKPPDKVMSWIQEIISLGEDEYTPSTISYYLDLLDYQSNWKIETKIEYLSKDLCKNYFNSCIEAKNRQVISKR